MRFVVIGAVVAAVASAAGGARAQADEALGPRAVATGEALRAAAHGSLAVTLNPAGVALARTYVLEGSYGHRPGDGANTAAASVCDSATSRIAACLSYDFLDADPPAGEGGGERRRHRAGLTIAAPLAEIVYLGVTGRYVKYVESVTEAPPRDHSRDDAFLLDAGVIARIHPLLHAAVVGYNLVGGDEGGFHRAIGGGLALNALPTLLLGADARYDLVTSTTRLGGGAEYFFTGGDGQQGFPVRVGYLYDTLTDASYVTGGLGFVTPRIALDVGARRQVTRGDETMAQVSLRFFFPH